MPASSFIVTRVFSKEEEEKLMMKAAAAGETREMEKEEEKEPEREDDEFSVILDPADNPGPEDVVMVRSKVAPVLVPVHKGLMPHHHLPLYNSSSSSSNNNSMYPIQVPMLSGQEQQRSQQNDRLIAPPPGLLPHPATATSNTYSSTGSPVHALQQRQQVLPPYQTYLEVNLPQHYPFHPKDTYTKNQTASNALIFLLDYIGTHDATARIAKFPSQANETIPVPSLLAAAGRGGRGGNDYFPNTIRSVNYYLQGCRFHPSGAAGKAKILLLHTLPVDTLLKSLNTRGSCYHFALAQIQAANVVSTVWLLGTTEHTNCKDLTTSLLNTPEFRKRPEVGLLLRQKIVKLPPPTPTLPQSYNNNTGTNGNPEGDQPQQPQPQPRRRSSTTSIGSSSHHTTPFDHHQVFAVHVYTAKDHARWVLETLKKLYNNNANSNSRNYLTVGDDIILPPYGQYYVVPDSTLQQATTSDDDEAAVLLLLLSRDEMIEKKKQQQTVLKQCTCLSMDLVGLVPYGGSPLLRGQFLEPPSSVTSATTATEGEEEDSNTNNMKSPDMEEMDNVDIEETLSKVLSINRHPRSAFTYTFTFHQKYTPQAMKAIDKIMEKLKVAAAAAANGNGDIKTPGSAFVNVGTTTFDDEPSSSSSSSSSHGPSPSSGNSYKSNSSDSNSNINKRQQLIPSTVLWHKSNPSQG